MSSTNISEERLGRAIRTYLLARSLFPEKIDEEIDRDISEDLFCRERCLRRALRSKTLALDEETLKRVVTEEIRNFQNSLEDFLKELEKKRSAVDKDLVEVDKAVSAFPNIYRDGLTLKVDGKILSYEIDILSGRVKGFCPGKHHSEEICVEIKEPNSCSSRRRRSEPAVAAFPNITNESIRRSTQIAINLANDLEIDDLRVLQDIYEIMTCAKCVKERKLPEEILDKLCDRFIFLEKQEEQEVKERKKERLRDYWKLSGPRLCRLLDELWVEIEYGLESRYE